MTPLQIKALSLKQISDHLKGSGLHLITGPFTFNIRSPLANIAHALHTLYADFNTVIGAKFSDYHVRVRFAGGVRRVIRPQSLFDFDGYHPFTPIAGRQAFAMLEWGMNWCIHTHAHTFLILHGAVLERGGRGLLLPAPSGSGKSTLCAALMQRGWRLLSDELILIDLESYQLHGLARPISLKNQSINVMRRFAPDAFISQPIHDTSKGSVAHMKPSAHSVSLADQTATAHHIIFVSYQAASDTLLAPVPRSYSLMRLINNAFNYSTMREKGFEVMAHIIETTHCYELVYSDLESACVAIEQGFGTFAA